MVGAKILRILGSLQQATNIKFFLETSIWTNSTLELHVQFTFEKLFVFMIWKFETFKTQTCDELLDEKLRRKFF